jgi:hypothetical protein
MNKQLNEQLEQATARIEQLIHLGGMAAAGDSLPDPIRDLLDEDDKTLIEIWPDLPAWVMEVLSDSTEGPEAFSQWVHDSGTLGFVVKIATPLMRNVTEPGCGTFSWGNYYTRWFYGETLEEASERGLAWVNERREAEFSKEQG